MANFTAEDIRLAQETEAKYGVPASVTLAQYALESGYGTSSLAKRANNYFGISGKNNGKYVMSGGRSWAAYSSKAESFDAHGKLLSSSLYASKTAGAQSVGQYVDAIAETYAPSSDGNNNYAGQLKSIIQQNNLTQYDSASRSGTFSGSTVVDTTTVSTTQTTGSIWGTIVKFIALVIVGVFAAVFFFNAFGASLNPKDLLKKEVAKAVSE